MKRKVRFQENNDKGQINNSDEPATQLTTYHIYKHMYRIKCVIVY